MRHFNPRAPCGARPSVSEWESSQRISIHVPLAGHDNISVPTGGTVEDFNPRAPCGARPHFLHSPRIFVRFQSTCPLRGTTMVGDEMRRAREFQSTCPLRGTTEPSLPAERVDLFQSTCPLRGTTVEPDPRSGERIIFQSTCPLRGTTREYMQAHRDDQFQSTCPLRGTTPNANHVWGRYLFQSTCPLRGTTLYHATTKGH